MISGTFGAARRAIKSPFDELDDLLTAFRGVVQAGYGRRLRFDDETDFRRSLTTARSRVAELAFLRALGENGSP